MLQKTSLNILFLCDFPFAGAGGVGRVTEVLAAEFMRRDFVVTYFTLSEGQQNVHNGITQYFLPKNEEIDSDASLKYVKQLLAKLQIDVIINQAGTKVDVLDFLAKLKSEIPVLSVHHNCVACLRENYRHIITENFGERFFFRLFDHSPGWTLLDRYHLFKQGKIFEKAIEVSARLVLLSEVFVPEVTTYVSSYPENKVVGIPNPAPFRAVTDVEQKKENRLLYVGRINYQQKRVDLLLDLWQRIYRDFPDWHFDVVGDGPDLDDLKKKAEDRQLERIYFHGFQDPRPYLEKAKFFCMTSAFEGYGMVLVEAQAYGVIPFAFHCFSAMEDIIQSGHNGLFFPKFDMDKYAHSLKSMMKDEKARKLMAENAQASVKKYDPTCVADMWMDLFDAVLKEKN